MKKTSFLYTLLILVSFCPPSHGMWDEEQDHVPQNRSSSSTGHESGSSSSTGSCIADPLENPYTIKSLGLDFPEELHEQECLGGRTVRKIYKGVRFLYSYVAQDGSTKNCLLRNVKPGDLLHFVKIFRHKKTMSTYMTGEQRTEEEIIERVKQALSRWADKETWGVSTYLLFEKPANIDTDSPADDGLEEGWELRGEIMLEPSDRWSDKWNIPKHPRFSRELELSYAVIAYERVGGRRVNFWGGGLGTTAVHAVLNYLLPLISQYQEIGSVFATASPTNVGSLFILCRNGFTPKLTRRKFGELRQWWELPLRDEVLTPIREGYWEEDPDLPAQVLGELRRQAELKKQQEEAKRQNPSSPTLSSSPSTSDDDGSPRS